MATNPFAKYVQQPAQGDPVIAPPDPYRQASEQRAQASEIRSAEDQQFQRDKFAIEQRRADRIEERANAGTNDEKKIATLLTRIAGGASDIQSIITGSPEAQEPGMVESIRGDLMPGGVGGLVTRAIAGSERRSVHDAQRDILDAALTLGTGAAYNAEQLSGQMASYFPQYGDTQDEIKLKNQRLLRLIEAAKANAGPAWEQVESRIAPYMQALAAEQPATAAGGGDKDDRDKNLWPGVVGEDGKPLPPEGGYGRDPETGEWSLYGRVTDDSQPTAVEANAARMDEATGKMGLLDLAGHGLSLGLTDEAAGIGSAIGGVLQGDLDIAGNYQLGRDTEQLRIDRAREETGWGGAAAEVIGGGALGKVINAPNALLSAGRTVAARGGPVTRGAIQAQIARTAAQEGALVGGVGGFGYGRGLEDSTTNALLGGTTGGLIGYGAQRFGNALANRASAPGRVAGAEVQQAADDLRIPTIPAVTGGTTARRLTAGARQGFISDRPIAGAVDAMEAGGARARNRAASATGQVLDNEDAGNVVREAANVYSRRTSEIGGKLYDRADRMAGDIRLSLPKAIAKADEWLANLAESAEGVKGQLYRDVKKLRDQLAGRDFSVNGIRQTRTTLREQIQERGLRGSATDKAMGDILEAATEDLFDGLTAGGKDQAAGALRTANAFWKKRVETIDQVLEPILGKNAPRSGEQIISAIEGLANPKTGNAARLRQLFDAMPREERQSVAATVISRMGQPTAGAAEKGSGFSFNTFLTNWNKMSPRARETMFPPETRAALDKLATVSQGVKQAGTAANTSNTGGAIVTQMAISGPMVMFAEPFTVLAATAGQWVIGRLLASPRIARWIAGAPANPQARSAYIARLGGIARAEPALANEIGIFERALRAANDNPAALSGVAAEEPGVQQQ